MYCNLQLRIHCQVHRYQDCIITCIANYNRVSVVKSIDIIYTPRLWVSFLTIVRAISHLDKTCVRLKVTGYRSRVVVIKG